MAYAIFSHPGIETVVSCNCNFMLHKTNCLKPVSWACQPPLSVTKSHKHCSSKTETWKVSPYMHYAVSSGGKVPRTRNLDIEAVSLVITMCCNRVAAVGAETSNGLDGPGIESRWRPDFPHMSKPAVGPTQPPIYGYRVFPGVKAAGAWR